MTTTHHTTQNGSTQPDFASPTAASIADYCWVDTAVGGVNRRNNVMRLKDFQPQAGAVDCYWTYFQFTADFKSYADQNPSPTTGKPPSVSRYPGPAWTSFVPFDFDHEENPAMALADAYEFIADLRGTYAVPPQAIRIFWSGNKGVSLEIPASLFGGFEPSTDIAERVKRLATTLLEGHPTGDTSIYDKLRLWRVPNTRHGKSGLYKVPLSEDQLFAQDLEAIRQWAQAPRKVEIA